MSCLATLLSRAWSVDEENVTPRQLKLFCTSSLDIEKITLCLKVWALNFFPMHIVLYKKHLKILVNWLLKASFKLRILDLSFVNEFFVKRGNI